MYAHMNTNTAQLHSSWCVSVCVCMLVCVCICCKLNKWTREKKLIWFENVRHFLKRLLSKCGINSHSLKKVRGKNLRLKKELKIKSS